MAFANKFSLTTNGQVTRVILLDEQGGRTEQVGEVIMSASDALELARVIQEVAAKHAASTVAPARPQ